MSAYTTDWKNIDLNCNGERRLNIIEPLSFDTLLLEINCNLYDINEVSVTEQFLEDLNCRITDAKEVFFANLQNLVNHAKRERES